MEDDPKSLPATTRSETALDALAVLVSVVPWIGSPISNIVSGISTGRKIARVREVLLRLAHDLAGFESEAAKAYVKTDEFEELVERTVRQAADERSNEKRRVYSA